ncbi:hypothetical protein H6P81_017749 [Aristolochia fimbriata]|uniref:Peptidoglycan binding-like domain-containing protein n=1 Tax=Aristolochia fimbriata TaxID=158543 RepID=A0AAV7E112_ARIFI|nr:hypothetical protein H6P81_017749 [Aristolochia fimbriata]
MGSVFLLLSLIGVLACSSFCMSILAHEYRQLFDDQEMQHLEGSRIGETVTGLHKLKHYLARFGYLDRGAHVAAAGIGEEEDRFDDGLESALKLFQRTHKLNVSGVVDSATLDLVKTPRCGVPDFVNGSVPHNISTRWVHYKGKIKWPRGKRTLTWSWLHPTLPYPFARLSIEYALAKWAEVTGFTFKEIPFEKHRDVGPRDASDTELRAFRRRGGVDGGAVGGDDGPAVRGAARARPHARAESLGGPGSGHVRVYSIWVRKATIDPG